jgi:sugar phosphate permease
MPKIRWLMIWLCFLANAIAYIDRTNIAVATPAIRAEMGIDAAAMGLVLSAFFWTYAFLQLPAGWFIDRVGVRIALTLAVGWWSLFTAATALARTVVQFIGLRLMLGAGESFSNPSFAKTAFNWFPRRERGLACSIFNSGSTAGSALSLPLVTLLMVLVGWRGAFVATGFIGIAWAVAWWFIYRDPERWRAVAPAEIDRLLAERETPPPAAGRISWFDLFRYRSVWGLMLGLFCLNFAIYFFITWFPSYLLQARGFSLAGLGTLGSLPALMGVVGNWVGGFTSDRLLKAGWSPTRARKTCLVGGMLMSSSIALAAFVESSWACLALFTLAYASLSFAGANCWTVVSEIAPTPRHVASIGGIQNCAGNLAGILITTFTGVVLTITSGSFLIPLAVAGAMCVLGALSYLFLLGKVEPLPPLD